MNYDVLPYMLAVALFGVGLYAVVCKRNVIKLIVGIIILDYGVNLFLLLTGYRHDGVAPILTPNPDLTPEANLEQFAAQSVDPVPQALILTSIVIGLGVVALMTALAVRIHEKYNTFDLSQIRQLKG